MFSKSCEYAIRAVIIICQNTQDGHKSNLHEISEKADVPAQYIAKLLQKLVHADLIQSSKGPGGGFFIKPESKVRLIDIVKVVDGDSIFTACGLGLKQCNAKNPCPLHYHFLNVRTDLKKMLENTMIHELSEQLKDNVFVLNNK
ncbi:MAG: Rrf2 family transcriptional regulator [Bacteroidia bacterium]|nr:Rrf2 family transcriptional regulator [Bacteroidia bacterium]